MAKKKQPLTIEDIPRVQCCFRVGDGVYFFFGDCRAERFEDAADCVEGSFGNNPRLALRSLT